MASTELTEIEYPDSDGKPMAESDQTRDSLIYAVKVLRIYFQNRQDVYVSGNLFIYYEQGNPAAVVAPDVFVVLGINKQNRRSYKVWEEGKTPDFVLEITSKSTKKEDQNAKPNLYAALGVQEYFQYDPTGDYLKPRLQGLRLVKGSYQQMEPISPDEASLKSDVLGLELQLRDELRFYDSATDKILLSHEEEAQRAQRLAEKLRELGIDPNSL
ncbi:MAG: Uma2 family endonuclease [Cyanophyceae cyanobacterium]